MVGVGDSVVPSELEGGATPSEPDAGSEESALCANTGPKGTNIKESIKKQTENCPIFFVNPS